MNTTLVDTNRRTVRIAARRVLVGSALAAALVGSGAGIALAESPPEPSVPEIYEVPSADPGDPTVPDIYEVPPADPGDPTVPDIYEVPPGAPQPEDPPHSGPGTLADPPPTWCNPDEEICEIPPCDPEVEQCEPECDPAVDEECEPECDPAIEVCDPECDPAVDEECPVPPCEEGSEECPTSTPTTTTPMQPTPNTDRPTFDTGDEPGSDVDPALLGGAIALTIGAGGAAAVVTFRRRTV